MAAAKNALGKCSASSQHITNLNNLLSFRYLWGTQEKVVMVAVAALSFYYKIKGIQPL
jgi:hypothetical protein